MGIGDKIISILVASAILTFWTISGGFVFYEEFLTQKGIQIGEVETIFSGYVLIFLSSAVITYILLWTVRRRRVVV